MKLSSITFLALLLYFSCHVHANSDITITDSWINEAPPNIKVLAGYGVITNESNQEVVLTNISSPDFAYIELHRTLIEEGVAKMQKLEELVLLPQSDIQFEPGGMHMMLFEPVKPMKQGTQTRLDFHFSNGISLQTVVRVKKFSNSTHHHHHHH